MPFWVPQSARYLPSGEKATEFTAAVAIVVKFVTNDEVAISQIAKNPAELFVPATAIVLPSGEKEIDETEPYGATGSVAMR